MADKPNSPKPKTANPKATSKPLDPEISQQLLLEKDMRLKAMVEAFDGLIYICSQDYRVEYMNRKYIQRIGHDATGEICYKALHNRDSVCPWCLNPRIYKGETVRCEVLSHRNKWYHVVSTPIFHTDGSVSKHAMIIDITKRKAAEQTLKKKVEEQELLLDNIHTQIWYLTGPDTYGAVNKAHAQFLGMNKEDIEGKSIKMVLSHDKSLPLMAGNRDVFKNKVQVNAEEWAADAKGERRLLSITKTPNLDGDGNVEYVICSGEDITERKRAEEALRLSEAQLREENLRLRSTLKSSNQFGNIIGKSRAMGDVFETILKSALSLATVIIYGESGTGKELVAHTIHELSNRNGKPFVTVNCGAIPENLLESEFFGYKKGAFTGANIDNPGYLDSAEGGTLFLDEVGELDPNMQAKLLRAIEGGGYTPIGSREIKKPHIRIIAATNRNLLDSVKNGTMREDFYYRIHIIPIHLPPLRERKEDLPLLVHHFLQLYSNGETIPSIPGTMMNSMQKYDWPGNVRELQNTIHRYITLNEVNLMHNSATPGSESSEMPLQMAHRNESYLKLKTAKKQFEKEYLKRVLKENRWHRGKTASLLGINRKTLFKKIRDHGLEDVPK